MMIKIIIQEERPEKTVDEEMVERYTGKTHFVTTNEAYSEDRVIIAALLRGIADRFDPR